MAKTNDRNWLAQTLADMRSSLDLLIDVVSDEEMSRAAFGFSIDIGLVTHLEALSEVLDAAAGGDADLSEFAEAAGRLAGLTQMVRLALDEVDDAEELARMLLGAVVLAYITPRWPHLAAPARLAGMLDEELPIGDLLSNLWESISSSLDDEEGAQRASINLAAVGLILAFTPPIVDGVWHRTIDPEAVKVLQGWETDPTRLELDPDGERVPPMGDRISKRFMTVSLRLQGEPKLEDGVVTSEGELDMTLSTALVPRSHGGPGLWLSASLGEQVDLHLGSGWHFVIDNQIADAFDLFLAGEDKRFLQAGGAAGGRAEIKLERRDEGTQAQTPDGSTSTTPAEPWRLGGLLEAKAVELGITMGDRDPMLQAVARVRDAALVLERPESGFLKHVLPSGGVRARFDIGIVVDSTPRWYLEGGTGLEVTIPIHTSGPGLQGLHLFLALHGRPEDQAGGPPVTLEISTGFSTKLGGFTASLDRFGVVLPEAPHGPSGVPWLRFPSSIGLGLDFDVVKGGGFILFDPENGRYAGMLSLTFAKWSLSAFGLLSDLDDGYSLLIVFSIEWATAIQGPFGIGLKGIGGIIGHHHGANVEALQASMRTGAVGTILFPRDPASAAPRVLSTLANVFPVRPGSSLLGLGLKLTWSGGLVSLIAAVVVESGPTPRVVLLASLEMVAPQLDQPILRIRVDAVGIIDTERPSVEIDGSLVDSFIGPFALTGDGCFRFRGGDDGLFLLSVGGFHPAYTPPASANLPPQRRLTLALPMENPKLRLEQYWALTTNSIQIGARVEVSARKGGFSAEARLSFDALAQRDPFHLTVDIEARAAIRYDGSTLASVGLDLHLDGPDPWHLVGKARLELFFFTISIPIDTTFGDDSPDRALPVVDAEARLRAALADPASWETIRPTGSAALVAVRDLDAEPGLLVAHPAGQLAATQSVLPLGVDLTHLGSSRITPDRFTIDSVSVNGNDVGPVAPRRGPFAAGEFIELADDERLSRPSFERMVSGFQVGGDEITFGAATVADLTYEEIVIGPDGPIDDVPPKRPILVVIAAYGASLGAAAASPLRHADRVAALRADPLVKMNRTTSLLVDAANLRVVDDDGVERSDTELRQLVASPGEASGRLVVRVHEAVGAG